MLEPQQVQSSPRIAAARVESRSGSSGSGDNVPSSCFRKPAPLALLWYVNRNTVAAWQSNLVCGMSGGTD